MISIKDYNNSFIRVFSDSVGDLLHISENFTFDVPGARFQPRYKAKVWDGKIRLFNTKNGLLPLGLKDELLEFLQEYEYEYLDETTISESEYTVEEVTNFLNACRVSDGKGEEIFPEKHQIDAIVHSILEKRVLILSPTSSGKSLIIYLIQKFLDRNVCILVPSVGLVDQLSVNFDEYSQFDSDFDAEEEIHKIYSGKEKIVDKRIVISTWQSLQRLEPDTEFYDRFECLIVDEVHTAKANVLGGIIEKFTNAQYKLGFTGTLDDSELTNMKLKGLFGPVKQFVTAKDLMDAGVITPVDIRMIFLQYFPLEVRDLMLSKSTSYDTEMSYVLSNPRRNKFIAKLATSRPGNTLILFNLLDHVDEIKRLILEDFPDRKIFVVTGNVKGKERETIRKAIEKEDDCVVLATYGVFSTGISINKLHNFIFAHPTKSKTRVLQSIGRLLRKHITKDVATIFDIVDDFSITTKKGSVRKNYILEHALERSKYYIKERYPFQIKKLDFYIE